MCCDELLKKLPSTYLEACRDAYMAGNGIVRKIDLDKILRAAINDTLPKGQRSTDGEDVRRSLKGDHRVVLPEIMGPVLVPASLALRDDKLSALLQLRRSDCARPHNRKRQGRRNTCAASRIPDDRLLLWTPGGSRQVDPGAKRTTARDDEDGGRRLGVLPLVRNRSRPGRLRDSQSAACVRLLYPLQ